MLWNRSEDSAGAVTPAPPQVLTNAGRRIGAVQSVLRQRISFVLALVLVAFLLRAIAAVAVEQVSFATGRNGYIAQDDQAYDGNAWIQAQAWRGEGPEVPPDARYLLNVYSYTQAGLYLVIGHRPLAMKLLNCLFGALAAGVIYLITRQLFGELAARFSGIAAAFFPSTFLWSVVGFKDAMFILLVALLLGLVTWLVMCTRRRLIVPVLVMLALVGGIRLYAEVLLGVLVPITILLQSRAQFPRKWGTAALLLVGCAGVVWLSGGTSWVSGHIVPDRLNYQRHAMASGANSSYVPPPAPTAAPVSTVPVATTPRVTTPAATAPGGIASAVATPAVPTSLRAGTITDSGIEVLWDDNSDNEAGFMVLSQRDEVRTYIDVAADTTAYTIDGLPRGTTIWFYVKACNGAGCSVWSNYLIATTAAPTATAAAPTGAAAPVSSTTSAPTPQPRGSLDSLIHWFPIGLAYALAAPFPWAVRRTVELVTIPEMLLWYVALVFAAIGVVVHWRSWRCYVHILGYLAGILIILAVASGNLGTLVRQRSMIIPFTLIFSGAGAAWLWSRWAPERYIKRRVTGK